MTWHVYETNPLFPIGRSSAGSQAILQCRGQGAENDQSRSVHPEKDGSLLGGDIGRRWDSQLAAVYYPEMVYLGKNHRQAMWAVMSHLGARVLRVLKEDRAYELRDHAGKPISRESARKMIFAKYHVPHVPEVIRRERRQRDPVKGRRKE